MKNSLKKAKWGKMALPYLMELYRRHGAFYITDIYDRWMMPRTKRLL
jgi:hypothetical protein